MIPNKNKTNKVWPITRKTTELQQLAQKENFALFQLASIKSQIRSIEWGIKDSLASTVLDTIRKDTEFLITHIKCIQSDRKRARKKK